jgi:large subunit ribosomal protein L3
MGRKSGPRRGSMQIWPRQRSKSAFPRVNWNAITGKKEGAGFVGFIGYKVGMKSAYVKDLTSDSMSKNKRITIPVTIVECPTMKIFSIRFYKNTKVIGEVLNENVDKELKRKIKLPKNYKTKEMLEKAEKELEFDDIRVIAYSQVKKTGIKKKPNVSEIGLSGSKEEKLAFAKESLAKELSVLDYFKEGIVDVRGITIGRGTQGPVKRFGIKLRFHKTEKGLRKVGSIGPWHPARVSYRVPMAGQMGYFNRVVYNNKIVAVGKAGEGQEINPKSGFKKYGVIKNDYLIIRGSISGPSKRQLIISQPIRPSKKQLKKSYEFVELR